jgi:hypothetical protein
MDLNFFRRAEQRFATRAAASLDFGLLVAMLREHQAGSAAARAGAHPVPLAWQHNPLVELLLGGPGWREAASALRGSFNPAYASAGNGL